MLRVVAFFGVLAFALDRFIERVLPGPLKVPARRYPLGVALVVAVLALLLVRSVVLGAPYLLPRETDLHDLSVLASGDANVQVSGVLADQYIETFNDRNRNHVKEPGEDGLRWLYFLGTEDGDNGLVLWSQVPPDQVASSDGRVTVHGRLVGGSSSLEGLADVTPGFDPSQLPFRMSSAWLYQDVEFAELAGAREAIVIFGVPIALLVIAAWLGYTPYRRSPSDRPAVGPVASAPARAYVTGVVGPRDAPRRVRNLEVAAKAAEDTFGRRSVSLTPIGTREPVDVIRPGHVLEVGSAATPGGMLYAVRTDGTHGPLVIGFDSLTERDAMASSLASGPAASAA